MVNPQKAIKKALDGYLVPNKIYPKSLPTELQSWYCYVSDGGHCIVCVLKQHYQADTDLTDMLVPLPVKSVLRVGHEQQGGYIVVDMPYDSKIGLVVPEGDDEF